MAILPLTSVERIIRNAGAPRVSGDASKELREIIESVGMEISSKAMKFATHAGRKTVTAGDIKLAKQEL